MILSDEEIKEALRKGIVKIDPYPDEHQFSSSSLDLRLGDEFYCWDEKRIAQDGLQLTGVSTTIDPSRADVLQLLQRYTRPADIERDRCCIIQPKTLAIIP